jgi:hypothetical protein
MNVYSCGRLHKRRGLLCATTNCGCNSLSPVRDAFPCVDGFFGLAEGKRVMTTTPVFGTHYTTTANVRIYSPRPVNDVLHLTAHSAVVIDASHVVPFPAILWTTHAKTPYLIYRILL